ncbi:MAG: hypothetical protein JWM60_2436 [Solirubrobacterales bacterium]|nr:hypothetical protein [Solirubrobacterales bacterium]
MYLIRKIKLRRAALAAEDGFTMLLAIAALLITSLLVTASLVAAEGDIGLTHRDTAAKKAYYAAQAGINDYVFHLNRNSSYWEYCTSKEAEKNVALNQVGSTSNRAKVPGSSEEEYAVQLLPASTAAPETKCNPEKPTQTMIENGTEAGGTFRVESTGYSGSGTACKTGVETGSCAKRTLVATFSNAGLLNYIYYTKYETLDPFTYTPTKPQCAAFSGTRPSECTNIQFITGDEIKGPLHTEDTSIVCGTPSFGRTSQDLIEFKGWYTQNCSGEIKVNGTLVPKGTVKSVEPPPSNASLKTLASTTYTGKTTIALTGETMTVTNGGTTTTGVAWPSNGVIYVANGSCSTTYTPYGPSYSADTACGNVYVSGTYSKSLTIAAENDIVITGSLTPPLTGTTPNTGATLGLIANNFVRIYHPLTGTRSNTQNGCGSSTNNTAEDLKDPSIYAAILALKHSFIVDNFDCGTTLGKLNVYGAIAQLFRGPVGESGSPESGYLKNYEYDDRLSVESPPYFLNPVKAAWRVRRETLAQNP